MKTAVTVTFVIASMANPLYSASTVGFAIGAVRDSSGVVLPDGSSSWAIIVSNTGNLPGGLTDGANSITVAEAASDFENVTLTIGNKGDYTIIQTGTITGSDDLLGTPGIALDTATFDLTAVVTAGKLWGFYWFPSQPEGGTLSGTFEVGGFAQSTPNGASGGTFGTVVPADGSTETSVNFLESNLNQSVLGGTDTGLNVSRFTAVAVPETTTLTLSALGLAALLRRRRG